MSVLGIIVMTFCVGGSTTFLAWCIYRVMREPGVEDRLHSTTEPTPDTTVDQKK